VNQPRGLDAGRLPHLVAAGLTTFYDTLSAASKAVAARKGVVNGALGVGCGVAVALLLWQSFWYEAVSRGVALAASTVLAAVLLALPMRAVAGAFALTLSLSVAGLAVGFFVTSPVGATQVGSAVAPGSLGESVGGGLSGMSAGGGVSPEAVPDAAPDRSAPAGFDHAAFGAPVAGQPGREPVTPCHTARRWHGGSGDRLSHGACELRLSRP
jgi:hypothetical protein